MVLYANASKNDLTAPILFKSGSLKKVYPMDFEISKRTAMASLGFLVMIGLKFFLSMTSSTFSLETLADMRSKFTDYCSPVKTL